MEPTYFAGIGGQKCGTGWLYGYLAEHPQVCQSPIKEMHVFDWLFAPDLGRDDLAAWAEKRLEELEQASDRVAQAAASRSGADRGSAAKANPMTRALVRELPQQLQATRDLLAIGTAPDQREALRRYAGFFERRIAPDHRIFGEVTPSYSVLPREGFEAMLALYPSARLVFIMRDPVDRFWSAVRHTARRDPSFDASASVMQCLDDRKYLARSDYRSILSVLDASVPPDQVLTVFFEDLFASDDDSTLRRITSFLGIDFVAGAREEPAFKGISGEVTEEADGALRDRLADQYRYVADRFDRVPARWRERLALLSADSA